MITIKSQRPKRDIDDINRRTRLPQVPVAEVSNVPQKSKWLFLPSPEDGEEVSVGDYDTLFNGLEKTYLHELGSRPAGAIEDLIPTLIHGVFESLRELVRGQEFKPRAARKVESIFLDIQTLMVVSAVLSDQDCLDEIKSRIKNAIKRKHARITFGEIEGIIADVKHYMNLKHRGVKLRADIGVIRTQLSDIRAIKLEVAGFLNSRHPSLECTPDSLFTLEKSYKDQGRAYLRKKYKNPLRQDNILKEVFRSPKRSRM